MLDPNNVIYHADIALNSLGRLEEFMSKIAFPKNLPIETFNALERKIRNHANKNGITFKEAQAQFDLSSYYMEFDDALEGFAIANAKDNDKRKKEKKVSLRIIAGDVASKYVVISNGLYDLLNRPEYLSFGVKDSVLAIGEEMEGLGKSYEVVTGQHGFMINSASLVDYLCGQFRLIDATGDMNSRLKPYKTSFEDYFVTGLKMSDGNLLTFVFFYMPPSI